jgi:hypothetical protein
MNDGVYGSRRVLQMVGKHEKHFYKKSWVHFGFYWSNAYIGHGVSVPDDFGNLVWVGLRNQRLEISEH